MGGGGGSAYHRLWVLRNLALALEQARTLEGIVEAFGDLPDGREQRRQAKGGGGAKALDRPPRTRGPKKGPGRGHYAKDTPCIIAWVARTGEVVLCVVRDFTARTGQRAALQAVKAGSSIFTASAGSYERLPDVGFLHESVNHSQGEWGCGETSTKPGQKVSSPSCVLI